jgi:hypothetical protein
MGWAVTLMLAAAPLFAQEAPAPEETAVAQEEEAARPEPLHKIRVLQHPYDLASFYRSQQDYGLYDVPAGPYPIAGFYRNRQSSPYGQFWVVGYGPPGGYSPRDRGRRSMFGRRIGENGDLYLFAPVLLAPVGPLSDTFLEPR